MVLFGGVGNLPKYKTHHFRGSQRGLQTCGELPVKPVSKKLPWIYIRK